MKRESKQQGGNTMKHLAIVILALSTFTACGKSAADQLAEQKMEAVNSVCEEEAQTLLQQHLADQSKTDPENPNFTVNGVLTDEAMASGARAKASGQTVAQIQQAYYKHAKQQCVTRRILQ